MKTLGLGREIQPVQANDWEQIDGGESVPFSVNGVFAWNDYCISLSQQAFRQIGGNSNGEKWLRFYRAVPAPENSYPSYRY